MKSSDQHIFAQAIASFQAGDFSDAEHRFKKIIRSEPRHVGALNLYGILLMQVGRYDEAELRIRQAIGIDARSDVTFYNYGLILKNLKRPLEALDAFNKALAINPTVPESWNNRGTVFSDLARYDEAINDFEKATSLKTDYAEAFSNKGKSLLLSKRHDEAFASYNVALTLMPDLTEAWLGRGNVFYNLKRYDEACADYDKTLTLKPDLAEAWYGLGTVLRELKRPQEAIVAFRQALENGGGSEEIQYHLAALGAEISPAIAPKKFIENLFDQYADNFEEQLVEKLKYQSPTLLFDAIARVVPENKLDILDLGCGTGLFGVLLRPLARTLIGVDLSSNMLKKAQQHKVYDNLICSELNDYLQTQTNDFDLAVATDVFIYIGDLTMVFRGVRGALRDGGLFGFSVEANEGEDYVLRPTLRYAHSMAYLQKLAGDYGFSLESNELRVIRQDFGVDVNGYHVIMRLR